jgi:RNA polymerase sigma factor (sigma-70 family)
MTGEAAAGLDDRSDAEVLAAVRAGDTAAFGVLWARHEAAAHSFARRVGRPSDVDEVVSESFTRVLSAISGGGGPDAAFRPYLLSTIRRVSIDLGRRYYQRVNLTDDDADFDVLHVRSAADVADERADHSALWRAWASLTDSSREVLWHVVVEKESLKSIAPLLGTSPNGVATRANRAKERLRQAFVQEYIQSADNPDCRWTRERLGAYIRRALSELERARVEEHLAECEACTAAVLDATDINATLRAVIAPAVVGGPLILAGYLKDCGRSGGSGLPRGGRRAAYLLAAAAVVLVGGGMTLVAVHPTSDSHRTALSSPRPSPSLPVVSPTSGSLPSSTHAASPSPTRVRPATTATATRPPSPAGPSRPAVHTASTTRATRTPSSAAPPTTPPPTTPPPTTPPPTEPATPASAPPAGHSATVRLQLGRPSDEGELHLAASNGWIIKSIAPSASIPCQIDGSQATCTLDHVAAGSYDFLVTAAPPTAQSTSAVLAMNYTDGALVLTQDYPL